MARRHEIIDAGGEVRAIVTSVPRADASPYRPDQSTGLLYLELRPPTRERMIDDNLPPELALAIAGALIDAVAEIR